MPDDKATRMPTKSDIPTDVVTVIPTTAELPSIVQNMTPERILVILRSAEAGSTRDLFCLYRDVVAADNHIQAELGKRKLAVLGDQFRMLPLDSKAPADKASADYCTTSIDNLKSWRIACSHLLDSCLWPVAVVEKVYRPEGGRFVLDRLIPVPGYLLDYTTGRMLISDVDPATGTILSTSREPDPNRYIIHRSHLLSMPDTWGGPMRSILFWWLLSNMSRGWWARFLDRFGAPFPVGKYPKGDTASRNVLADAFALSAKLGGLVVSDNTHVELIQAAASQTGDAYEKFIGVCQREKSKLILGQTLSAQADSTGLGSGVADLQSDVRDDIRQFDAAMLSETIRDQLLTQICVLGGQAGAVPSPAWGSKNPREIKAVTDILASLFDAGISLADSSLDDLAEDLGYALQRQGAAQGDPADPDKPTGAQAAPTEDLQKLALNGAQVASLLAILEKVTMGVIPKASAAHILRAAFPMIPEATIAGMLATLVFVKPSTPLALSVDIDPDRSAELLPLLREFPANAARIIRESKTAAECQARLLEQYSAADSRKAAALIADALALHAALGAASRAPQS